MSLIDWVVFLGFISWVVWDGIRRSSKSRDMEGYFAGSRSIPWWAAGLSVMATQASAITVIGTSGQGFDGGMDFVQTYYGLPLAMVLLCLFMVPMLRRLPILSAYEFLETRFGPETRSIASLLFLVSRCLAFGVVLYAPSVVLSAMLDLPVEWMVVLIGALTTCYTMLGGVQAVIWTDVKQMTLILFGLVVCFGIVVARLVADLDVDQVLTAAGQAGKLNAVEFVPESSEWVPRLRGDAGEGMAVSFWEEKYNFWSGLIGGLFLMLAYFGADQSQVQRILTNPTARESRMALLMSAFVKIPMQAGILLLGVLLWVSSTVHPEQARLLYDGNLANALARSADPAAATVSQEHARVLVARRDALVAATSETAGAAELEAYQALVVREKALRTEARRLAAITLELEEAQRLGEARSDEELAAIKAPSDTNYIFPTFLFSSLPPVLLGLMIAAIFAAAMSSSDSALNSLTSAAVVDFYKRWFRPDASERQCLAAGRVITLLIGAVATTAAIQFHGAGSVIELVNKVPSYGYGSLFGVFALGALLPRAGRWAGLVGLLGGIGSVLAVDQFLHVEWLWYNVVGVVGVLLFGGVTAVFTRGRAQPAGSDPAAATRR